MNNLYKPTYFFSAYQYPVKGDVLSARQIEQKTSQLATAEVWLTDAREATEVEYHSWVKTGDFITAYDLNGSPRYWFKIRQLSTDRFVVDEATWA